MSTLYADHFQVKEPPFSIAPNPRFLFMSEQHREALAHLLYGIGHDGGFVLLTGEVGTGKTTLCRCLLDKVPNDTDVAFIINPRLSVVDLLANICDELHIDYDKNQLNNRLLVDAINHYLLERHAAGRKTVLIIDEAQNLEADVLEQLRLLTNLETDERKLLQIILLGQPELQDKLGRQELRQLSQRVTARYHLTALSRSDLQAYITHRLGVAGCNLSIFTPSALRFIHRRSGGIPRLINLICDRAMLGAYSNGMLRINRSTAAQAAGEVLGGHAANSAPGIGKSAAWVSAILLMIVAAWGIGRWMLPQNSPLSASSATASMPVDMDTATLTPEDQSNAPGETESEKPALASAPADDHQKTEAATAQSPPHKTGPNAEDSVTPSPHPPAAETHETGRQPPAAWVEGGFLHDRHGAFDDLFDAWGISLPARVEPCDFATQQGLTCQRFFGGLDKLRSIDRPAIIDWHREDGGMSYITVVSLDDTSIRAVSGEQAFDLPMEQFRRHWDNRFTVLWRVPTTYRSDILPGMVGPSATWLNSRLLELDPSSVVPGKIPGIYDGKWVSRLRNFQREAGLLPDGVAGPRTLIRLNTVLDEPGPRLSPDTQDIQHAVAVH